MEKPCLDVVPLLSFAGWTSGDYEAEGRRASCRIVVAAVCMSNQQAYCHAGHIATLPDLQVLVSSSVTGTVDEDLLSKLNRHRPAELPPLELSLLAPLVQGSDQAGGPTSDHLI